jgi:hypothetical protein
MLAPPEAPGFTYPGSRVGEAYPIATTELIRSRDRSTDSGNVVFRSGIQTVHT